jgi:tetratricopeptide (TPR) repeat protein
MLKHHLRRMTDNPQDASIGKPARSKTGAAVAVVGLGAAMAVLVLLFRTDRSEQRLARLDVASLQRIARDHPDDPFVFLALGRRLRQSGRLGEAFVMTSRAYDLSDGDPRFTAAKAEALIDRRDYAGALELAAPAATRCPRSGELKAQLSRVHALTGYFADALDEAEAAVRLSPQHAPAWQALGNACSLNKRPSQSFQAFEQAVRLEPGDAELLTDYGDALAHYGQPAEAEAMFARARSLAPKSARPVALLGQLKAERARTKEEQAEAHSLLALALSRAPEATDTLYQLAALDLRAGRYTESVSLLKRLLALDPSYGEAHLTLAQAYRSEGRGADARQSFAAWQRFSDYRRESTQLVMRLRRRPDDPTLLRRLIRLHRQYGNTRAAEVYETKLRAGTIPDRQPGATAKDGHP